MSWRVAVDETPLVVAFALAAAATEANPWAQVNRVTDGYLSQEAAKGKA